MKSTLFLIILALCSCRTNPQWEGQEAIQKVRTNTLPIQMQHQGICNLGNGIYSRNDFAGARLNGMVLSNDTLITAMITPENTPINESPWYAFKLWSESLQTVHLKLTYLEGVKHRYYPKLSSDGLNWINVDPNNYTEEVIADESNERKFPETVTIRLTLSPDTLWVSAQELLTSKHVNDWVDELGKLPFVFTSKVAESREGRPINMLKIGEADDQKMVIVISRQHPPEVTGYLAMQSFVETICSDNETARAFRNSYNTYVIPLVNPDGVHHGHWRHSSAGIDLNRDWENFNQVETRTIRNFLEGKVAETGGKFYLGFDFHSTYEDIYYFMDPALKGNMPGLIPKMIEASGREIEGYQPNLSARPGDDAPVTSLAYFYHVLGAESVTYEIGDNTPRDLVKHKGEVSAMALMELMLE